MFDFSLESSRFFLLYPVVCLFAPLNISEHSGHSSGVFLAIYCPPIVPPICIFSRLHPNQVAPGKRSPTVSQLDTDGWVAVQSLILKKDSSRVMDELQTCGATDILLFTLHNTRIT